MPQKNHKSTKVQRIFLPIQYSYPSTNQLIKDVVIALEMTQRDGLYFNECKE
jgi:hypothetical protein